MRVTVTGATGFIGRHYATEMLRRGHDLTVIGREQKSLDEMPWAKKVRFVSADVNEKNDSLWQELGATDLLVHLAWPGLPNYNATFHFEENLLAAYELVRSFVTAGCPRVLITGTCFEYGNVQGVISETTPTQPTNPYGLAKDCLHRFLRQLQNVTPYRLTWARLFYMYGPGQSPRSLISQLEAALERGDESFPMSGGEQLRDYLRVETVASHLAMLSEHPTFCGPINVCSGSPISVRRLVEQEIARHDAEIRLELGHYPYPDYEPFAFWGDKTLLQSLETTP
ncbi:NAD-dependent epimerase/dehydratase family protein [Rhodopirellula sallentina]|uniref:NAD-dependent epimerase/dehydratase n=1 Tax=Rhodopirellula sallentina SM41 TaxID=1263870 RepID=M5UIE2_9BACT|nr:NAD(P)-dependent oxidoreductase [Rhodopirellula sallentina]EMI55783.1 NAD-dependent epimerase/dehydratase [Rhodopirellula sallentina SM41]